MKRVLVLAVAIACGVLSVQAATTVIPQSSLVPDGRYYTDYIGGGIGSVAVMTGGGNAANIGNPSGRNDDGFRGPINLGFVFSLFGNDYSQFWANNNGNISFSGGLSQFTPTGPTGANVPIISPFFADVDTRGDASGVMHIRQDIANELIVTWDAVGYYGAHADRLDSFQLVVRGPDYSIPVGEGSIGFFYKGMGWETGDASGGWGGFGGSPAAVGFGDGAGNAEVLQGSMANGIAAAVQNRHIWFDQNLTPVPHVPDGGTTAGMLGLALGGLAMLRRRLSI